MDRAAHNAEHRRLCLLLRQYRQNAGLRQTDVAARLGVHQSFVSKYEAGERRLDLIELAQVCDSLSIDLIEFVRDFMVNTQHIG